MMTHTTFSPAAFSLSEKNALLLDMAEFSVDGGEVFRREEILRIDNIVRQTLGLPLRRKEVVQPYMLTKSAPSHTVILRFRILSTIRIPQVTIAMEDMGTADVTLNGEHVTLADDGWFIDPAIRTARLGSIHPGENLLQATFPIGESTNLEYMYLLGDFGVQVTGSECTLTEMPRTLGFGSVTTQGLPFYTGDVTYLLPIIADGTFTVRVPMWRGGLIRAALDGIDAGRIAFSPYALTIPATPGRHTLALTCVGTRFNLLGQLHHTPGVWFYQSPNSWRSDGDLWTYSYQLKPMGILSSPEISGAVFEEACPMKEAAAAEKIREKS